MAMDNFLGNRAGRLIKGAIAIVVVLSILAAVTPILFGSIGDVNVVFTDNATLLNNSVAEEIAPVFPILFALGLLLGLAGLIMKVVDFDRRF